MSTGWAESSPSRLTFGSAIAASDLEEVSAFICTARPPELGGAFGGELRIELLHLRSSLRPGAREGESSFPSALVVDLTVQTKAHHTGGRNSRRIGCAPAAGRLRVPPYIKIVTRQLDSK